MALQFVLGSSGVGKSYTVYKQMIEEAVQNPKDNYILLVPEQFSLALQRKMVLLHPNTGTMNIDEHGEECTCWEYFDSFKTLVCISLRTKSIAPLLIILACAVIFFL